MASKSTIIARFDWFHLAKQFRRTRGLFIHAEEWNRESQDRSSQLPLATSSSCISSRARVLYGVLARPRSLPNRMAWFLGFASSDGPTVLLPHTEPHAVGKIMPNSCHMHRPPGLKLERLNTSPSNFMVPTISRRHRPYREGTVHSLGMHTTMTA